MNKMIGPIPFFVQAWNCICTWKCWKSCTKSENAAPSFSQVESLFISTHRQVKTVQLLSGQLECYRAVSRCPSDSASHFSKACYLIKCIIHYSPSPMIQCAFKSACAHIKTSNKNHQEKPLHSNCSIKMIPSPAFLLRNTVYST